MAGDDDKPRKSWREIDQARESGRSGRGEHRDSGLKETSREYRNYKSKLNALFEGSGDADAKGRVPRRESMIDKPAARSIVDAVGPKAIKEALAAYRAEHGFPEDEEALGKILDLSDEALVLEALSTVARLHGEGKLKRAAALKARIKTAQATIDDRDVQARAREVLALL